MRLDLNDDQQFFLETLRRFVGAESPISTVRARIDADEAFDRGWWRRAAELGVASFLVPEELGGGSISGRGPVDLTIVAEEFGRAVVPSPLVPVNVVAETIARSGNAAQRELLSGIVDGSVVPVWALDASGAVTVTASGDGFTLDGAITAVEAADQADYVLITVDADAGPTQFLLPVTTPGLSIERQDGLDLLKRFGRVQLDGVAVGPDEAVGPVGGAAGDVARQRQVTNLLQCAEMCGAAARVLEFTIEYGFDRFSFGRPLASYQALKHRFADMKLWLEASFAITDQAADAVAGALSADGSTGDEATRLLVHAAKSYVGDRSVDLIQDCVQLHGGIGVTWEHDIHLYLRRATVDRGLFGGPAEHRAQLAASLAFPGHAGRLAGALR